MKPLREIPSRSLISTIVVFACLFGLGCAALVSNSQDASGAQQQQGRVDKRKFTKIQTAALDVGQTKNAVEVRYLDLPYGAATFGYMEVGGDRYYSNRTWPIAHLKLATTATYDGKALQPGDYVFYITPKNDKNPAMTLSLASFKPDAGRGTYLEPGNVFTDTPKDAVVVSQQPVTFDKGAPMIDHLTIGLEQMGDTVGITFHYGDRTLTEKLALK